jgi:myo-inositol-1(or 4)-monophosphatase
VVRPLSELSKTIPGLIEVVEDLGRQQVRWRQRGGAEGRNAAQIATEADRLSAEHLRKTLHRLFPDDGLVGEELPDEWPSRERVWVIDPLDGTRNYAHGLPIWGISLALMIDAAPVLGVFHLPDAPETFHAIRGEGAHLDGEPLAAPHRDGLGSKDLVTVGGFDFPADFAKGLLRRLGCSVAEQCYLAAGRLAAMHLSGPRLWDVAAGSLIAREAGCTVRRLDDVPLWPWQPRRSGAGGRFSLGGWGPGVKPNGE